LAIGVGTLVTKARPEGMSQRDVAVALRFYTTGYSYVAAMAASGSRRFHLDGSDAGEVSEEHRQKARERVEEWHRCRHMP
jgi:sRNA-binding protein